MFSGIVETTARVAAIREEGGNRHFTLECPFTDELKIDQSIAHNGVCLTVVSIEGDRYTTTAIRETLLKSNLGGLRVGDPVNLERSMRPTRCSTAISCRGTSIRRRAAPRSTRRTEAGTSLSSTNPSQGNVTVEKGSVAVNGVSLTVVDSREGAFRVAIIPYTYEHTNFHALKVGSTVNLEFDIVGKYIARLMERYVKA